MIDIIIPVLNEEDVLRSKKEYFLSLSKHANLMFVDGKSEDRTAELAKELGTVVASVRGRGVQKNCGVQAGQSDIILFLHVDTTLNPQDLELIEQSISEGSIGGCFRLKIKNPAWVYRIYEQAVNMRAKYLKVIDGDLGMFVRRDIFERMGGMDNLLYLEDLLYSRRLRKVGPIAFINRPITASARKWQQQGMLKTFWQYSFAYILYYTGCSRLIKVKELDSSKEHAILS